MRQVLESDRKIKALSLLKFSSVSVEEMDRAIEEGQSTSSTDEMRKSRVDAIVDKLQFGIDMSASDANCVYYVSGAAARSTVRVNKCESCKECLILSDKGAEPMQLED